jgi:predicted alpha-1,2-mannosidase
MWNVQQRRLHRGGAGGSAAPAAPSAPSNTSSAAVFYSMLYHSFLAPTIYSEYSGQYPAIGGVGVRTWTRTSGTYRSDMSLWDIFRTQAPWLGLVAPASSQDVVQSLLAMTEDGGHLPRWPLANVYTGCMVGERGAVVITDAALKGQADLNLSEALSVVLGAVDAQASGAPGYESLGYIPFDQDNTGSSLTLDYAFDDGIAANLANFVGDATDYARLLARSHSWQNVMTSAYPAEPSFPGPMACPRLTNGTFQCDWDPALPYPIATDFVEGDAEQYRWFVFHEPERLVALFPSNQTFADALDSFFNLSIGWGFGNDLPNPYYWPGNEPTMGHAFLFPYAGNAFAWLAQKWARYGLDTFYSVQPDGLPGNDDYGTLSCFATWSMLGLYPMTGRAQYVLVSPVFASAAIQVPLDEALIFHGISRGDRVDLLQRRCPELATANATILSIQTTGSPSTYLSGADVNGAPLPSPILPHDVLFGQARAAVRAALALPACAAAAAALSASAAPTLTFHWTPNPVPWQ